ncbi:hypothetical protein LTR36_007147 [Oleoguttula mirabilis]|uniref:Pre-mRNA-processing factor 39 n=1 Tax=Oleoguttula mirabilis TaxID=1507867 RepID=A0AAV9JBC3_9PEZI|nr:hypothetical protein LTR36_007147 [Oleoguttula mirabilis]
MADFSFADDRELQKLNAQVLEEPEEFEHWEKLVRAAESQEGGLNRNSSPQAIAATRDTYDRFLARFPLFFGYWKKYADLEFAIAGTEAAEMVYERGIASIGISVDLWANYCGFKLETTHDIDVIRDLFERGAESVGLDFLAHPFWDKYLEFEERLDAHDRVFKILDRIIHIPMHQYARYFERYRTMAQNRPLSELAPEDVILSFRREIEHDTGMKPKAEADIERELRTRLDNLHFEAFQQTQTETTKRWTYEQEVKRPYYHVTDLDGPQLANWRKYLDFEESEGDYTRTKFLYERCLVTAANYDEFWFRYARWMLLQGKQEEVRNIYQRASCIFVPIVRPAIRLYYAQYEESIGQPAIAVDIHEAILMILPNHLETILSLANLRRRQSGVESAIMVLKRHMESPDTTTSTQGALVSEWARLVCDISGRPDQARKIYEEGQQSYHGSRPFWFGWFSMEVKQGEYERVKAVYRAARACLSPDTVRELTALYLVYLQERGGAETMKEWMVIDAEVMKSAEDGAADSEDVVMGQNGPV